MSAINGLFAALALFVPAPAVAAAPCLAEAHAAWPDAGPDYSVEAVAGSSTACGEGTVTIAVRGPDGDVFWAGAQVAKWNNFLNTATDSADLGKRLAEMIDPAKAVFHTTADLPDWKKGAKSPMQDTQPFFPEQPDPADYAATRAEKLPLLCFREAVDYLGCYALVPNGPNLQDMMKVGQLRLSHS